MEEMRLRAPVAATAALVGVCAVLTGAAAGSPSSSRLVPFAGCPSFGAYMEAHAAPLVRRYAPVVGIAAGAQPGAVTGSKDAGVAYSGTNVQEEGVDEPDTVKTDGRTLYVTTAGRISAVDVRSGKPALLGSLKLDTGVAYELLLHGDRLLALSRQVVVPLPGPTAGTAPILPRPIASSVTEIDVSRPAHMQVVRTMQLDGEYLTARLVGSVVRIVSASAPLTLLPLVPSVGGDAAKAGAQNRDTVRSVAPTRWLPRYTVRNAKGSVTHRGYLVQCRHVLRAPSFSGLGLTTVLTVDLDRGLQPVDSDALAADARTVYASPTHLYIATSEPARVGPRGPVTPDGTWLHEFDVSSPTETRYRASGHVAGVLLDQWSLSERDDVLRVASTALPVSTGGAQTQSETSVTTLAERNGALVPLGRVGGLGKGERVYAVRFVGDVGYVVTFRQIDPLYTVDLSDPRRPAVRGELELRGYSAYLHPVGNGLLLGIGQDATKDGATVGTLASLFDVSDPARPKRLDSFTLARSRSQAEYDHHAFLWWAPSQLAVIPVETYLDQPFVGALALNVRRSGIREVGQIAHPSRPGVEPVGSPGTPISRSVVVGDTLYTVSVAGVKGSSLATLAGRGFVRLPFDKVTGVQPALPTEPTR
jgi:Beta propeller domain